MPGILPCFGLVSDSIIINLITYLFISYSINAYGASQINGIGNFNGNKCIGDKYMAMNEGISPHISDKNISISSSEDR
jgi:hypothetical protein